LIIPGFQTSSYPFFRLGVFPVNKFPPPGNQHFLPLNKT
jgi:hypothetical protein